jgi:uracil phosphoribosyltransferase
MSLPHIYGGLKRLETTEQMHGLALFLFVRCSCTTGSSIVHRVQLRLSLGTWRSKVIMCIISMEIGLARIPSNQIDLVRMVTLDIHAILNIKREYVSLSLTIHIGKLDPLMTARTS